MNKNLMNISAIELFFSKLIDGKVSSNTYVGSLPSTIKSEWADIVLIDYSRINDLDAYGKGTVLVYLYAKPMNSGKKNMSVIDKMERSLNEVIANNDSKTYNISRRLTYPDYDSARNLHYNVVEIITTIL